MNPYYDLFWTSIVSGERKVAKVVKIGARDPISVIFSNKLLIYILLFPFFKTSGFDYIAGLSTICNAMLALECLFFGTILIFENRMSVFTKIVFILEVWIYFIAPCVSGYEQPSMFYFTGTIGLLSFFELGMSRKPEKLLDATRKLFLLMIILNAALLVFMPSGFQAQDGSNVYLFGLRTGFSLFIIPAVYFNLIIDKIHNKPSVITILTFVVGAFSLLNERVATGLLEMGIIIALLIVPKKEIIAKKINFVLVAVLVFAVDLSMTVWGFQNRIMNLVSLVFNKDITLSGRTLIWEKTMEKMASSPLAGVGKDATVQIGSTFRPAHNQWLHVGLEGGYVAMVLFIFATLVTCFYLYKKKNRKWYAVCAIGILSILVGSIAEIQTYVPFIYVVLVLPFLLEKYLNKSVSIK